MLGARPHVIIDDDGAARVGVDVHSVEPQAGGVRGPARRDQQAIADEGLPVYLDAEPLAEPTAPVAHLLDRSMGQDAHAFAFEGRFQPIPDGPIGLREQGRARDERDLRAQAQERLPELHGHHGAPVDDEMLRQSFRHERLGRGPVGGVLKTRRLGDRGRGADRDQDTVGAQALLLAPRLLHQQGSLLGEVRGSA